ncbi:hypothetical protein BpHYR1_037017 [Brachionus plicatilis]|uniref:Uncharacterized protein n=1 Tax=Brachionus plicatilis TaxID=10195 RepID=A0A3M7SM89_BRAPC|nr:hypothetical protein BpHYR1_037017 [Brachionus plicatilis]
MESNCEEEAMVTKKSSSAEWNAFSGEDVHKNETDWADFGPQTPHVASPVLAEDEWTDFVENPKIVQNTPFLNLIENFLHNQNKSDINFCENIAENELNIEQDATWNELKRYTTINDESLSLKFKWSLSSLEDEYLKSLNLQRQLPVQTKQPLFFKTNEILQPVKIDLDSFSTELVSQTSPKKSVESLDQITNSSLNIDLSYFEKTEPENTSKNYLNKLLSEIYTRNGSGKDEDADKKSITSTSSQNSTRSNSSNRLAQKSIQLEPLNLEKQFNIINLYQNP